MCHIATRWIPLAYGLRRTTRLLVESNPAQQPHCTTKAMGEVLLTLYLAVAHLGYKVTPGMAGVMIRPLSVGFR